MPAILIHLAFGYILYCIFAHFFPKIKEEKIYLFLFLLGSLIPDIKLLIAWITYFIFNNSNYALASTFVTHQIFGSFLVSLFLSATLFRKIFIKSLLILTVGFLGHFLLDICQYPFASINHMLLLYPFYGEIFYISLGFLNNIPIFEILQYFILVIAFALFIREYLRERKESRKKKGLYKCNF